MTTKLLIYLTLGKEPIQVVHTDLFDPATDVNALVSNFWYRTYSYFDGVNDVMKELANHEEDYS